MASKDLAMHASKQTKGLRGSVQLIHLFAVASISVAVVIIGLPATAQTPAPSSKTKVKTTTQATQAKAEPLSGAQLWAINCSRCHMARGPGEFTAGQWQTILREMRVRANLPAAQARELQKFLEAGAGK
jgi:cytochrome c553